MINARQLHRIAVLLMLLLAIAVSSIVARHHNVEGERAATSPQAVREFLWPDDQRGIAVAHLIRASDFPSNKIPTKLRIVIDSPKSLLSQWEVVEVSCFKRIGGSRLRLSEEGPWVECAKPDGDSYLLLGLDTNRKRYEVDVILRQKRDARFTLDEVLADARRQRLQLVPLKLECQDAY